MKILLIKSKGIPVKYKGKNYPSISACWSAVKPNCSYMSFVKRFHRDK